MKQGWEIKKLGEVGKVSMCKRVFKEDTTTEGDIPFYKIGTFGKSPDAFITKERYNEFRSKFSFPKKGDILISASGTIGRRVRYDGEPAYFQDSNIVWIDNNEKLVLNDYLYRFYEICNWGASKGATISRLYNDNLKQIEITYPKSLPEQQRIVAILDEAFAAIAKAKANAEQNLKNAKELFESYLQGVFENGNWEKVKLSELAKDITDGDHMPPPKSEDGFPFITISNINKQDRQIDFSDTFKVPKEYFDKLKENRRPKKGDVLYTVTGSYGIPVLIEGDFEFCFQRHIGLIRPKDNVSSKWLYYWILSPNAIFQANDTATGTAQKTVSLTALRNFVLPKMTLKQQQIIVRQLDALSAETKKLETIYQQKINDLEELKKSVLQKAFSGELSSPEGASSANDGHSPSDKTSLITSRERAIDNSVAVTPLAVIKHKLWDSRS